MEPRAADPASTPATDSADAGAAPGATGGGAPPEPTSDRKRNLVRRRVLFGLTLIAITGSLITTDYIFESGYGIAILVAFVTAFGVREVLAMLSGLGEVVWRLPASLAGVLMVALALLHYEAPFGAALPREVDLLVIVGFVMALASSGLCHEPSRERLLGMVLTSFGVIYVLGLGCFALRLRYLDTDPSCDLGFTALAYAIVGARGTDVCAFFVGRYLGKRKLIPWISPGKTVAGAVGSLVGAVAITAVFLLLTDLGALFPWWAALPLGILIGVVTMVGDLVESLIKRSAAVKDSGRLVPEFGGVLDIVDSVLFVMPVVYVVTLTAIG